MSKKNKFWLVFVINLVLLTISALLKYTATIGFVLSSFWWWDKEHALKRDGLTFRRNPLKRSFALFGGLEAYRDIITILYYIALLGGSIGFVVETLGKI